METEDEADIKWKSHEKYLADMLKVLPQPYSSQDAHRLTLIYFIVSSLDLLGKSDKVNKKDVVDFVYSMQVLPDKDDPDRNFQNCGFRAGPFFGESWSPQCEPHSLNQFDQSHLAITYVALALLRICGDDGRMVNRRAITRALRCLQLDDGSFCAVPASENDMRFVFCAAAVSHMLDDWSGIDVDRAVNYIVASQSYDGGIGQGPGQESHGGSTYCALAALKLMGRLDALRDRQGLIQWCVERQVSGFQGRINKVADCCYSFWIGASLTLLSAYELIDFDCLKNHTAACQHRVGGFAKWPDNYPDVLHTYMALCGLSLGGDPNLLPVDAALGFSRAASGSFGRA
eukprot:TRINITY_DN19687_c0_g1_i1.p1 TRINITY_DN19687_c0_g1~~TRINITY_DN19687_c0_g1_i1.p1  ORF type:complete len:365 (+),score=39.11 TRINITY_DN19687_c0_g1_i1:65-1096(+)